MQDIQKEKFSAEEKDYSHKNTYQDVKTAYSELDKNRKIAVIFLVFFSLVLFIFWMIDTKRSINAPLKPAVDESAVNYEVLEGRENIDTDGDGLYNWEEIEIYGTSPYLEDTDGDGISDLEEVNRGTNPLCPEGQVCVMDVLKEEEKTSVEMDNFINENINLNINPGEAGSMDEETFNEVLQGELSAASLRKMLLDAGMDQSLLSSISDEDLLSSYQEVLQ